MIGNLTIQCKFTSQQDHLQIHELVFFLHEEDLSFCVFSQTKMEQKKYNSKSIKVQQKISQVKT